MSLRRSSGFTLVELSIVLVIVGLLSAGIFVGRDLIEAARVRRAISQIQEVQAAVNTFRVKYNQLPGDFDAADSYWSGAVNGNNDGQIEAFSESYNAWSHLSEAGLVKGAFAPVTTAADPSTDPGLPASDLLPGVFDNTHLALLHDEPLSDGSFVVGSNDNYLAISQCSIPIIGYGAIYTYWAARSATDNIGVTPVVAQSIDAKIDDGLPKTGATLTMFPADNGLANIDPNGCNEGVDNLYNLRATQQSCMLKVRLQ